MTVDVVDVELESAIEPKDKDWNSRIIVVCAFSAIGGLLFGYDTGIISGVKDFESYKNDFNNPSSLMNSVIVSAVLIGAMIGATIAGPFCDSKGRRLTVLLGGATYFGGALIMALAVHISMLIVGMGVGLSSQSVPLYITEIAPARLRGSLVSLNQLFITIGIMVSYGVNVGFHTIYRGWSYSFGISMAPALLLTIGMFFLPETPYWLVMHNKAEKASIVLQNIRQRKDISVELSNMQISAPDPDRERCHWREILAKGVLKIQCIFMIDGLGLTIFQQIVGINSVIYYAPEIFSQVGYDTSGRLMATLLVGFVNVLFTVVSMWLIDKVGRRILLLVGSVTMCVAMIVIGVLSSLNIFATNHATGYAAIAAICVYIAGFAFSWGPIAWVIPPEIYPLRLRSKMITVSTFGNWIANFAVSLTFLLMFNAIGWIVFILFAGVSIMTSSWEWWHDAGRPVWHLNSEYKRPQD